MMWNEGMWSNAITVVNVTFSAMIATNYYEPLANWLEEYMSSYTYLLDYISLWLLFTVSCVILRLVTDRTSKHRVRFRMPMEHTGRVLFAAWTGWVIICFTCFTLHTAPLARSPFRGSFQNQPQANNFLGLAPDRMWLGFIQSRSEGALSAFQPRGFDPQSEFILKYGARRQRLDQLNQQSGSIRVGSR
jgi:hypothetical protein